MAELRQTIFLLLFGLKFIVSRRSPPHILLTRHNMFCDGDLHRENETGTQINDAYEEGEKKKYCLRFHKTRSSTRTKCWSFNASIFAEIGRHMHDYFWVCHAHSVRCAMIFSNWNRIQEEGGTSWWQIIFENSKKSYDHRPYISEDDNYWILWSQKLVNLYIRLAKFFDSSIDQALQK